MNKWNLLKEWMDKQIESSLEHSYYDPNMSDREKRKKTEILLNVSNKMKQIERLNDLVDERELTEDDHKFLETVPNFERETWKKTLKNLQGLS